MPCQVGIWKSQGPMVRLIETHLNNIVQDKNPDRLPAAIAALENGADIVTLAMDRGLDLSASAADALIADWVNGPWPDQEPIFPVIGKAIAIALERAGEQRLLIKMWLLCDPGAMDVSAAVSWSDIQVNLEFKVPATPAVPVQGPTGDPIVFISRPGGPGTDPEVMPM